MRALARARVCVCAPRAGLWQWLAGRAAGNLMLLLGMSGRGLVYLILVDCVMSWYFIALYYV